MPASLFFSLSRSGISLDIYTGKKEEENEVSKFNAARRWAVPRIFVDAEAFLLEAFRDEEAVILLSYRITAARR